jgi:hypothetical protein
VLVVDVVSGGGDPRGNPAARTESVCCLRLRVVGVVPHRTLRSEAQANGSGDTQQTHDERKSGQHGRASSHGFFRRCLTTERSAARARDAGIEFGRLRAGRLQRFVRRRLSWARSPMPMKHKDCEERNEPATLTERGLAAMITT